jgi:LysR family transcriptional regulator, regulator for genes of the gallate degradation pathway
MAAFRKGDFDFIIALLDEEDVDPQFTVKELFKDELVAVVRPNHPVLDRLPSPALSDLVAFPWIYPKPGSGHRRKIDGCIRAAGLSQPFIAVEGGGSGAFIAGLLVRTDYVAALSAGVVAVDGNMSSLATISLGSEMATRRVGIIHRGKSNLSPAARALVSEVEKRRDRL